MTARCTKVINQEYNENRPKQIKVWTAYHEQIGAEYNVGRSWTEAV
jgi:hypothetical protein